MQFPLSTLAFIGDIGGGEMILIGIVCLMLFGGQRLPELARGVGKAVRDFKKATAGVEDQIKQALEEAPARTKPTPKADPMQTTSVPPIYTPPPVVASAAETSAPAAPIPNDQPAPSATDKS